MNRKIIIIVFAFCLLLLFSAFLIWFFSKSDTSIVGTSTTIATLTTNFQRHTFYANNRHWIFYCNGSQILYTSSSDGANWKTSTVIRRDISSSSISFWYDGKVHYAYASGYNSVIYCQGSISGDGIEWDTEQEVTPSIPENTFQNGYCLTDSDGYPWVAYTQYDNQHWSGYIVKATSKDGSSWATRYKVFESTTLYTPWRLCMLPLEDGKILAIYTSVTGVKAKLWNGSAWGTEENVTMVHLAQDYGFSVVSYKNVVHLALLENETYNILHFKRTMETGWNQEAVIERDQSSASFPVLCVDELTSDIYCFWVYENAIYLKKYVSGVWEDSSSKPFGTISQELRTISCSYKTWDRKVGLAYVEELNMGSLRLKYKFLEIS